MPFDTHSIFAASTIKTIVSNDTTNKILIVDVQPGDGAQFAANQQVSIGPINTDFTISSAMIARITAKSTDRLTIDYSSGNREGSNVRTVQVGDLIFHAFTPKVLTDIENALTSASGVQNRSTSQVQIANSTAETNLYSFLVPGNLLSTANMLRLTIWGQAFNNSGSNIQWTLNLKYGATVIASTARAFAAANAIISFKIEAFVMGNGAANAQKGGFLFTGQENVNGGNYLSSGYGSAAEDSTVSKNLILSAQLGTASVNATFTKQAALLELL